MRLRQALALHLSTDLHEVARTLKDADETLLEACQAVSATIQAAPPELAGTGIYALLEAVLEDVTEGAALVIEARAALTGRTPEALLRRPPNRG